MSNVKSPELWTLLLRLGVDAIDYMLYSTVERGTLRLGHVVPDNAGGDALRAVENAVYDTPLLLDDYGKVRVLFDAPHFLVLPGDTTDDDATRLLEIAYGAQPQCEAMTCHLPQCDKVLAWHVPQGMPGFLGRTFNLPDVYYHLYPLCEHFHRLNVGSDISRMFLCMRAGAMDMIVYSRGELLAANTFKFTDINDAVYFALHAWESLGLDQHHDEIQLVGNREHRALLVRGLSDYVKYVMPSIFPAAALRLGKDVMNAPTELTLLSLCE